MLTKKERRAILREIVQELDADSIQIEQWQTCQTIKCFGGWAASDPRLNNEGLVMKDKPWQHPAYLHEKGFDALVKFFGLTQDEIYRLFSENEYPEDSEPESLKAEFLRRLDVIEGELDGGSR